MRAVLVAVTLLAACGHESASVDPVIGPTHEGGAPVADGLTASCGSARFDELPPDTAGLPSFTSWEQVDLSGLGGEGSFFDAYHWYVAGETEEARNLFGRPRHEGGGGAPYAYLSLELREGRWTPVGWGDCRIEVDVDGWGNARFEVDRSDPPDPEATRVSVLATEMGCAGGGPPTGRDVRAVVVDMNDEAVSIVILVEPPEGAATCPGNPSFPFEVELGAPLGDREILDASIYPSEVRWPS